VEPHPVRLELGGDLQRSRLTVFFRLLLAIPHYIWIALWGIAVFFAVIVNWIATLVTGRSPAGLHRFIGAYIRYWTHLLSYLYLAANPYPEFTGSHGDYPVDLAIDPSQPQQRWKTALRLVLAFPALLVTAALGGGVGGGGGGSGSSNSEEYATYSSGLLGVAGTIAFFAWFSCLVRGRMPQGFRNAVTFSLAYSAQAFAYFCCLTDRYPDARPRVPAHGGDVPEAPVRVTAEDDLRRSRLTVFFRLLLTLPHIVWLMLWGIAAFLAAIAAWFAALFTGRVPDALHRFLSAYLRYDLHVVSFLFLMANPFPGFTGREGSYPVDVQIDGPERQHRLVTGFRFLLAFPALVVNSALGTVLFVVAFLGWFASLALGRMPAGLRALGQWPLRYQMETYAYASLLTARYAYSGPPADPEPEAGLEPLAPLPPLEPLAPQTP
jgi:Domain of unknown function (DUF4389)